MKFRTLSMMAIVFGMLCFGNLAIAKPRNACSKKDEKQCNTVKTCKWNAKKSKCKMKKGKRKAMKAKKHLKKAEEMKNDVEDSGDNF